MRAAYYANACVRYSALMYELCALGVRPNFATNEAWNRYREYWANADFKVRSEKASQNKKSEKDGPGTGYSKHTDGLRSFQTYGDILALDKDDVEVLRRREEYTQATQNQPIDEQIYYDAACSEAHEVRGFRAELVGNVHGLQTHSLERRQEDDDRDIQDWVDEEHLGDES
ncbi:hypothetical protein Scep_001906 [Stephania cephalantha]|uniref:Uncharacterized protein n=1 Tax=Stephania cephalantha TaxID=152367 RepID=A0AAP0LA11_9MAGN